MRKKRPGRKGFMKLARSFVFMAALVLWAGEKAEAHMMDQWEAIPLGTRLTVGDPALSPTNGLDGPKDIVVADFDGDGKPDLAVSNKDGSVTVYYGKGDSKFDGPVHLHTGTNELRGIVAADFHGTGLPDLAIASPVVGTL